MIDSVPEPRAWTPRRQWIFIAVLFAVQLWLIHHFNQGAKPLSPINERLTTWTLLPEPIGSDELATNLLAEDPTLYALPNGHGFTGASWAAPVPTDHRPQEWPEPARFLGLDADSLGHSLAAVLRTRSFPPFDALGGDQPSSESLGLYTPREVPQTNSVLIFSGELSGRELASVPVLPALPVSEIITNSTVRVSVNSSGTVLSAVLTSRSGRPEADATALRLARQLRFRALSPSRRVNDPPASSSSWGEVIFVWGMLPMTNAVPAAGSSAP